MNTAIELIVFVVGILGITIVSAAVIGAVIVAAAIVADTTNFKRLFG
ncbi:hypothetical protein KAR91_63025 [Candidatus Pacearchaeota archaeon]|nr:hypothetical protein [Candidatus Pacearchaeota archaeon]